MSRRLKSAVLVPLVALAAVPALAHADRTPTGAEAKAIATAAKVPARCLKIRVSTVNEAYAGIWRRNLKKGCEKYQADGIAVYKKGHHGWKFVTAGSSFDCPVPGTPKAVAKDLGVTCHN
ncbi:hypothetical protein Q5424_07605 [Conexibacter sp. JD483]|uniref:hypothetical protein n=1 Tax=unclassified Conexibacter TaxID=2627773 RepID=UPI002716B322|nr:MULTISPECIES: hypothetical protein [unclassified Conexibacter]MDO8186035.1 hypothetical protein [Conexibacter sp. CPCC 205706]MDO8199525.1 hypothetical protein [Conexibacter sp. CPCC 205762]MDR9368940.1 hypothetical protein [Conexibacter sp. JD483]